MAADNNRALAVRERTIAPCAHPGALISIGANAASAAPQLSIFGSIPPRCGVIRVEYDSVMFREGEAAVYDEMWTSGREPDAPLLDDGAIYVTEHQRPVACMTWENWWEGRKEWCPSRLDISRTIVRVARCKAPRCENDWMIHPLATKAQGAFLCSDGPLNEFYLANKIIGKVVGIYRPALEGRAAA